MKKIILLSIFIFALGCKKNVPKDSLNLSTISKVRLVTYPSRMFWNNNNSSEVKNIDSIIKSDIIIDDIFLKEENKEKFISLLEDDYFLKSQAGCYDPRHLFVFYDNENKVTGYYEMCLECGGWDNSKNLDYLPNFCIEKGEDFKKLFVEIGLKNTGKDSKLAHEKEQMLLSKRLNSN